MRRGTTPTHTFTLPFSFPSGACIRIVYAQNDVILVEKTTEDCEINGAVVKTRLTSEETLRFDCSPHYQVGMLLPYPVEIQIGLRTAEGEKFWSAIIIESVERCLREDGVI